MTKSFLVAFSHAQRNSFLTYLTKQCFKRVNVKLPACFEYTPSKLLLLLGENFKRLNETLLFRRCTVNEYTSETLAYMKRM